MASRPGGGSIADAVSGPVLLSSNNNNRDESLSRLDHASRAANTTLRRKFGFTLISRRGGVVVCTRQDLNRSWKPVDRDSDSKQELEAEDTAVHRPGTSRPGPAGYF